MKNLTVAQKFILLVLTALTGIAVLAGVSMVVTNLTVDLLYGWLDPRIGALLAKRMRGTDR